RAAGEPAGELELFEQALAIRRKLGDDRETAESLFHVGLVYQVVRDDHAASLPWFAESIALARNASADILASSVVRHIRFVGHLGLGRQLADGAVDAAGRAFRESLELRRRAGWVPGVAAAELALAGLLAERGRREEALELAESAERTFTAVGATRFLAVVRA